MIKRLLKKDKQPSELSLYVIREFARQYNAIKKRENNCFCAYNITLS